MELRHLLYFKTVAEQLHFRKAAAALFISQPPLSRQIKELEEELGAQLFVRSNKRVILTDAGQYFKGEVDAILARLEESKTIVRQIHLSESGELKIGYISSVYEHHLAEVLKTMREVFPYIRTSLYEVPTVKQIEALEQGKLDVGILRAPVHSEKLKLHSLFFDPFTVVVPSAKKKFTNQDDLAGFIKGSPFIFFNKDYAPHYYDKLVEICERLGFKPNIVHEANNVHSILQLIEAGLGVSILPSSLEQQYSNLNVSFFKLNDIPIATEVILAYKKSNSSPALKWFIDKYS
ncbi:LysR family transcriptional regulator [Desertivirga xinjiangensis]|uniref:LysR family transcriptional regulator n=1 Tax=Desertivirga xinjiangensis TaxID=539206 RepID=UPI00210AE726|nr:LysR substrate-binding domain-containing protein [Pedobacter xinjiangensis]